MLTEIGEARQILHFLEGGGEMGALTRSKDWSRTPLGHPSTWPQHLRTALGILLNTKFPMFLWWGDDMIQFYNDAYRPSLGNDGKHPHALGNKAIETWQETWEVIYPLIGRVKTFGEATWSENQLMPIYRNGKLEDVYWTFGYSPVKDDRGRVDGVLALCTETTDTVLANKKLEESNRRFRNSVAQAPVPICVFRGPAYTVEMANERMLQLWGKPAEAVMNKPVFEGLPDARHQGLEEVLGRVYNSGEKFIANERPVALPRDGHVATTYVNFVYEPLREADRVTGIMAVALEVTEQVLARQKVNEAEERWRLAIEASDLGTFDLNLETDVVVCSPRFYEIFGLSHDVHHNEYVSMVLAEDQPIRDEAYRRAKQTGRLTYEVRVRRTDGALRWIRVDGKMFDDGFGKPVRMLGTLKDITEQQAFAQALEQKVTERTAELNREKQLAETILDASVDVICLLDRDLRYLSVNKKTEEMYGVSKHDFIGRKMTDLFPTIVGGMFHQSVLKAFAGETVPPYRQTSKVNSRHYETFVVPIFQDDEVYAVLGIGHDYTDVFDAAERVRHANELLAHKNRELENMNKELSSFAYVASHDLQEPLRKIQVFADRIKTKETLGPQATDYFERMQSAATRMQKLIDDLLTYSRTNTAERNFERIDPGLVVAEVLDEHSDTVRAKNAVIEVGTFCEIAVIRFQFKQLMANLIGNALKFSHADRTPCIRIVAEVVGGSALTNIGLRADQNYCRISVSDNGIGFEPEYSERIFEVFQRLHGKKDFPGTGIGLAICKKIAENHQGVIVATGEPDRGATFDVYLPVD